MSNTRRGVHSSLVLVSLLIGFAVSSPTFGQENRYVEMGSVSNFRAPNPKDSNRPVSTRPAKPSAKTAKPSSEELKRQEVDQAIKGGNTTRGENNYELALASYRRVITELKSEDERAYYGLGNVYVDLYCHDSAVEAYLNAIKRNNKYVEALIGLGYAYAGKERFDDAETQFRAALKVKSDSADANIGLGRAHLMKGKYQEAMNQFNLVINSPSFEVKDKAAAHVALGDVYWKQDKRSDAIKEFEEAIRLKPDFAWAHVELGNARSSVAYSKAGYFANPSEVSLQELEEMHAMAKRATAHHEDAKKYGYNHPQLFLNIALSLAYQDRYGAAAAKIDEYFAEVKRLEERVSPMTSGCGAGFSHLRSEGSWYRGYLAYLQGLVATDATKKNALLITSTEHFKDSISLKEDHVGSHWMLGNDYVLLERYQEAASQYEKALHFSTEEPIKASLYGAKGLALSTLGKYEDALQNYQEAIRRNPNKPEFYRWIAGTYISQRKLEDAIAQLKKAEELKGPATTDGAGSYYSLGVAYGIRYLNKRNEDDFVEAIKALRKLIELRPKFASAYDTLGGLYLIKGDAATSLENHEKAITLDPKNPVYYMNVGRVYSELKNNDDAAVERFKKAIEIKPDFAWGHQLLGQLYRRRKDDAEAVKHLQYAIRYDPNYLQSYLDLAGIYRAQKNYDLAIKLLTTAIGIAPKDAQLYRQLGLVYLARSNAEEALTNFNRAIEYDQNNSVNYFYLSRVYSELRHDDEAALKHLLKGIELNQKDPDLDVAIAEIHRRRKNYPEAIKYFESAIQKAPNVPWIYKDLAKVYEAQGKNEDAIRYYDEALKRLDPNDSTTPPTKELYLGRKARLLGNYPEAIEHFHKVNYPDEPGQSYYEIGVVYVISKKKKAALAQYEQLKQIKSTLAEDLLRQINDMK